MYIDLVMGLNFVVDLLLLLGAEKLAGYPIRFGRLCIAASVGGIYGGMCLLHGFRFLGNVFWRMVFLGIMASVAFGLTVSAIRRAALFVLLSMALGGIAVGIGKGGISLIACAIGVTILCTLGFCGRKNGKRLMDVELWHGERQIRLKALEDTGNTLIDPVTGCRVLVVGAQVAGELVGLSQMELAKPLETLSRQLHPGLRLIPYKAVGQPSGMLLAKRMDEVRIDGQIRDMIVAFAPQILQERGFEALVGGIT